MQLVEERAPNDFARIEDVISQGELESIAKSFSVAAASIPRSSTTDHLSVRGVKPAPAWIGWATQKTTVTVDIVRRTVS
jgi:hypothetical protein